MKKILKPAVLVLVTGLSLLLSISSFNLPKPMPADAPEERFSSTRAMEHVEKIAITPHPMGSLENYKVRDYIMGELEKLGLKPQLQKTYVENDMWDDVPSGNVENISAVLEGTDTEGESILMVSHYDSTPYGPGASDDAAAVASLLETIRALKTGSPLRNDVVFLFTDGEEDGLLGAKAFVDESPLLNNAELVMNFEARGNRGPVIMFETAEKNGWLMKEFKKAAPFPVAYSFAYDIYKNMPNNTDFTMFKNAGKPGFNFAPIAGYETYHSPYDNPDNLNQRTLQHQGTYALSLVKHFGDLELADRESANAIYFTLAKSVFVLYPEGFVIPLAALGIILFAGVIIMAVGKKAFSLKKSAAAFGLSLGLTALSAGVGLGVQKIFDMIYMKNRGNLTPDEAVHIIKSSNVWMIALVLLTTAILYAAYHLMYKKASCKDMLYGTLFLWAVLTAASSVMLKGASYMFVWPLILVSAGLLAEPLFNTKKAASYRYIPLLALAALSCILIYLPASYLLFQSMTFMMASAITGLLSLPLAIIILSTSIFMARREQPGIEAEESIKKNIVS